MDKLSRAVFLVMFLAASTICTVSAAPRGKTMEYVPFKAKATDNWGLIGIDGKILFENMFKNQPSEAVNGRFTVKNSQGLYELYTAESEPCKVGGEYKNIGAFIEDVAPAVEPDSTITFIDRDGNVKFRFAEVNGIGVDNVTNFIDGLCIFELNDSTFGCINTEGKVVVKPEWNNIHLAGDGKVVACTRDEDLKTNMYTVFDIEGNVLIESDEETLRPVSPFHNGYGAASATETEHAGLINEKGEWVLESNEKYLDYGIVIGNGKFIYVSNDAETGLDDFNGNTLIEPKYDDLTFIDDNHLIAKVNERYYILDSNGAKTSPYAYKQLVHLSDGILTAKGTNGLYSLIDVNGKTINDVKDMSELGRIIHSLSISTRPGEEIVSNDLLDVNALIKDIGIAENGMFGITFNTTVKDAVQHIPDCRNSTPDHYVDTRTIIYSREGYYSRFYSCAVDFGTQMVAGKPIGRGTEYSWSNTITPYSLKTYISCFSDMMKAKEQRISTAVKQALEASGWKEAKTYDNYNAVKYINGSHVALFTYHGDQISVYMGTILSLRDDVHRNFPLLLTE